MLLAERTGLTSIVEEAQVGQHKPPLFPQLHPCTVLQRHQRNWAQLLHELVGMDRL